MTPDARPVDRDVGRLPLVIVWVTLILAPAMYGAVLADLPYDAALIWLVRDCGVDHAEAQVLAEHVLKPLSIVLSWAPGLFALRYLHGDDDWTRSAFTAGARRYARVLPQALVVILTTYVLLGWPTEDVGTPAFVARVPIHTKAVDVLLNALEPGLMEEYYFRGRINAVLRPSLGPRWTLLATTTAFAASHPAAAMPWAFLFGLVLGVIRARQGSVAVTMAIHTAWNAVALLVGWGFV